MALTTQAELRCIEWGGDLHVPHGRIRLAHTVAKKMSDAGLTTAAYGSYYRAGESEPQGTSFSSVLETALALRTKKIRIWAGSRNAEDVTPRNWRIIVRDIRRVTDLAAQEDVRVVLEFHAQTLTNSYRSTHKLLEELPATGLIWQPISRLNPEENLQGLQQLSPWVEQVHCFYSAPPIYTKSPLSQGKSVWKKYLEQLAAVPVAHILLEFVAGNDPAQLVRDAKVLKRLLLNPH